MHILRLTAKNFRCFVDFKLELEPGFNLLMGGNGAGKTAVLEALKIGLGGFFQGFPGGKTYGFGELDMRLEPGPDAAAVPDMQPQPPTELSWRGQLGDAEMKWKRQLRGTGRRTTKAGVTSLRNKALQLAQQVQRHEAVDLPVFAYFGTERLWLQKRHGKALDRKRMLRQLGYVDCLERESSWVEMRNWLAAMTVGRERALKKGMAAAQAAEQLVLAIESAVCLCVPDTDAFVFWLGDIHLRRREQDRVVWQSWDMLSDGVRSLTLLAAQIAWRAAVLNPHHGQAAAKQATGVVLIDEVCLGLHPTWQRQVVAALTKAFPKLQFVATTHSPQVLGSAKDANIILLENGAASSLTGLYGKDSNSILAHYQGASQREVVVQQQIDGVERLIAQEKTAEAQRELQALETLLDDPDDIALVRLRTLLRFFTPSKTANAAQKS